MSESTELEIPEASYKAMLDAQDDWDHDDALDKAICEVAAPIVAAELRRVADKIGGTDYGRVAAQVLHARADELDPK